MAACVLRWRRIREPADFSDAGVRQSHDKLFYASPVIAMATRYHFRVVPPWQRVKLRILETHRHGPLLPQPSMAVGARSTMWVAARSSLRHGWTLKIVATIQWRCDSGSRARAWCRVRTPPSIPALNPRLATAKSTDYTSPKLSARG